MDLIGYEFNKKTLIKKQKIVEDIEFLEMEQMETNPKYLDFTKSRELCEADDLNFVKF